LGLIHCGLPRIVIPAEAGIQKSNWMPDQVRHDVENRYPAACGGVVGTDKCEISLDNKPKMLFYILQYHFAYRKIISNIVNEIK